MSGLTEDFSYYPKAFLSIEDDSTIFEKHTLDRISKIGMLSAFKHEGFCMQWTNFQIKNF